MQGVIRVGTAVNEAVKILCAPKPGVIAMEEEAPEFLLDHLHPCPMIQIPVSWFCIHQSHLQYEDLCVSSLCAGDSRKYW